MGSLWKSCEHDVERRQGHRFEVLEEKAVYLFLPFTFPLLKDTSSKCASFGTESSFHSTSVCFRQWCVWKQTKPQESVTFLKIFCQFKQNLQNWQLLLLIIPCMQLWLLIYDPVLTLYAFLLFMIVKTFHICQGKKCFLQWKLKEPISC